MMLPETVAGRGSDKIASCLLKYIKLANVKTKKLVIYSNNCAGQNKNYRMIALYIFWSAVVTLKKFIIAFRCEVKQCCHSIAILGILSAPSKMQKIYTPNEYALAVGKACKVNPCKVHKMQNADFVSK